MDLSLITANAVGETTHHFTKPEIQMIKHQKSIPNRIYPIFQ